MDSKSEVCASTGSYKLAIFVFTEWGEILLLKNPIPDSPGSGRWGVLERVVSVDQSPFDTTQSEVAERLKLRADPAYLDDLLSYDDRTKGEEDNDDLSNMYNGDRAYAYTLSWEQYQSVQHLQTQCVETVFQDGFSDQETTASLIRFVGTKELFADIEAFPARYTSILLDLLRRPDVESAVMRFWAKLVARTRDEVIALMSEVKKKALESDSGHRGQTEVDQDGDVLIMDAVLPSTTDAAAEFEVQRIFTQGKQTCPGAYRIGEMMNIAGHLKTWNDKLSDPYHRYVEEELELLRRGIERPEYRKEIESVDIEDACAFVRQVLHFPLEDGSLLRSGLGNLQEIAAGRRALRWYLRSKTSLPKKIIEDPIKKFSQTCNNIVRDVWNTMGWSLSEGNDEAIYNLLRLNVLLNSIDFKSREFLDVWSNPDRFQRVVEAQFKAASVKEFAQELGENAFVRELLEQWISPARSQGTTLVYLTDNNGQLAVSLKCIESFLWRCPGLNVIVVPKNGQFGNDTSWQDMEQFLEEDKASPNPAFSTLRNLRKRERWLLCRSGPSSEGLDPGNLSRELCLFLHKADVIFAEGRAYAQIRGWHKPTYLIFPVKGRVAESLHGVPANTNALSFVRVGSGIAHFSHLHQLPMRIIVSPSPGGRSFHAWGQTTADYVRVVQSENYSTLRDRLFGGREETLLGRLQEESLITKRAIASIVLGTTELPGRKETRQLRTEEPVDVFAIGGGGGFNQVTLKALKQLGVRVVAGVPATDDGGSTGRLQKMIAGTYGYMFGMGDAAAILEQEVEVEFKKRLLSFRPPEDSVSLSNILIDVVREMAARPTDDVPALNDCPDLLSFVSEQLNLARTIDTAFLGSEGIAGFGIKGASIRNLNILAAFHKCGALRSLSSAQSMDRAPQEERTECAWLLLEKALGLRRGSKNTIRIVPVTYNQAVLKATYNKPISESEIERLNIPCSALFDDHKTVYGQQYIDQIVPDGKIVDFSLAHSVEDPSGSLPKPSNAYLSALKSARLIIVGAGSLYGSQLAQLAVPCIMDVLIQRKNARRVLVINHVCMNETSSYSLIDHIKAIERLANSVISDSVKADADAPIRIGDIFTDVVVPRTVAREIDHALETKYSGLPNAYPHWRDIDDPQFVTVDGEPSNETDGILRNRYVAYILDHLDFRRQEQITDWELRILGFLEQPPVLYHSRSEAGRYRGAIYAREKDIKYLVSNGIPRRHIYEVESIAMNKKYLKETGIPKIEMFPGLIPESLVGIFRILLAKGHYISD